MGRKIVVSWSEIDCARQCPHKHELAYKERWQDEAKEGGALARGILWHEVMQAHYLFLKAWREGQILDLPGPKLVSDDRVRNVLESQGYKAFMKETQVGYALSRVIEPLLYPKAGDQSPDQSLIEWMYEGHLRMWALDEGWEIVAVEHGVEYPLYNVRDNITRFRLKTKIDLIVRAKTRGIPYLWLVDHKSGRDLPKGKDFDLMDQFALYEASMRRVGRNIFGTIHNAARTQRNKDDSLEAQPLDTRFKRHMMTRTPELLRQVELDCLATLQYVYSLPVGQAPRHPDEDRCGWRCSYTEACLAGRKGLDEHDFLIRKGMRQNFTRH